MMRQHEVGWFAWFVTAALLLLCRYMAVEA